MKTNPMKPLHRLPAFMALLVIFYAKSLYAATPYVMSTGNYSEGFGDIANWGANFASGTGAAPWSSVGIIGSGTSVTTGTRTTKSSATFVSGSTGGLQKGNLNLVFLSTGSTTTPEAVAVDLLLDFTGRNAGTLSFDWAAVDNSSGTRPTSLRVFWSTDNTTFTEITAAQILDVQSVNSGSISAVALPSAFNGSSTARLRFYNHAGTITGSGTRDKISIDNIAVTSTASGNTAPTVTTQAASSPSTSGATLNGTVTSDGGAPPLTDRGFYWSTTPGVTTSSTQLSEGGTSVAAFSAALSGLSVNTIYYYRAYAANSLGTGIGSSDVSFYTLANTPSAPTVGNPTASSLDVTIGGGDGNPGITTYAIKEAGGQFVQAGGTLGASAVYQTAAAWGTKTVTGLLPTTAYSFTVQAKNGDGVTTGFGSSAGDTTAAGTVAPSVTTQAASSISTSGAILNGTVTADGGASITDRGFYWKGSAGVTTSDTQLSEGGTSIAAFSQALASLSPNTNIFYRAYAANSVGTTLASSDVSFYTLAGTPSAPTVSGATPNSLNVAITMGDGNPSATLYAIQETTSGNYVQASGALGASAVYQTLATWGTKPVTGLSANTTYTFQAKAQNGAGTDTSFGSTASGTTQPTPLAAWDFTGEDNVATSAAEVFNPDLDSSSLVTRGSGAAASVGGNSFRTQGFQNNGISTANNDYFQITLSAGAGKSLSLSTIDARFTGTTSFSASPGVSMQFAYSLDGSTFTLIGSPVVQIGNGPMTQIDVSGISALQDIPATTTVTIRYYASGQTTTGGWGFNSPFTGAYGLSIGGTTCTLPTTSAISGATLVQSGQAGVSYSVTGTSGSSYVWTVPSGATITAGETGPDNNAITVTFGTTAGSVGVTETSAGGCTGSQVSLSVTVNHAPVATNDVAGTIQGQTITLASAKLLANDSDPDGNTLTITAASAASGSATVSSGNIQYTAPGSGSSDTITYTVSDGFGGTANATITVSLTSANAGSLNVINQTLNGSNPQLTFAGVAGVLYAIDHATSVSGPWTEVSQFTFPSGVGTYVFTDTATDGTTGSHFYRTRYVSGP